MGQGALARHRYRRRGRSRGRRRRGHGAGRLGRSGREVTTMASSESKSAKDTESSSAETPEKKAALPSTTSSGPRCQLGDVTEEGTGAILIGGPRPKRHRPNNVSWGGHTRGLGRSDLLGPPPCSDSSRRPAYSWTVQTRQLAAGVDARARAAPTRNCKSRCQPRAAVPSTIQ